MFDNLRDQASSSPFFQEDLPPEDAANIPEMQPVSAFEPGFESGFEAGLESGFETGFEQPAAAGRFLGMTAQQRFLITLLLFFAVCLIGASFLVVTGKFFLSFG